MILSRYACFFFHYLRSQKSVNSTTVLLWKFRPTIKNLGNLFFSI